MRPTVRFARSIVLVAALAASVAVASARAAAPPGPLVGIPHRGAAGHAASVTELMELQARTPARERKRDQEEKVEKPDRSGLPQNPASPDAAGMAEGRPVPLARLAPDRTAIPAAAHTVTLAFVAATLAGTNPTFSFPPDCMGAVGPTQFVVFVNGRLVTFNKTTGIADGRLNVDPDVFFASVRNGAFTSDPRIRYDRLTGRWFLAIINVSTPNRILIAVSDGASGGTILPSTVFTFFYIDIATTPPAISNTCLADYPTLGIDANALYIGTNNFCGSPIQTFNSSDGYVVRKSSILGAGPMVVTALRGLVPTSNGVGPYTPQGVDNFDPAATEGYFIGVDNATFGKLMMRRVSDPGGTPSVSANVSITVPATSMPQRVPHLGNDGGNNGRLSALDDRLYAAHIRNGRLWTAHNIYVNNTGTTSGTTTRNGSRWYELSVPVGSGTPTIVQSGTVFTATGNNLLTERHYWVPSIMVSGQGHAALGASIAGTNERANAAVVGRLASDPLGTMQTPAPYTFSVSDYNPPDDPGGGGGRRWGDYSYTSLDPLDDMTMWNVHMFCNAEDSYGVVAARLRAPAPATPASIPDVTAGQASVAVTLTGTSADGTGFYDPGANLPGVPAFNHLSATVLNGSAAGTPPIVTSATWVNPTTVNLVLDASGATANVGSERYTVRITNPDGQTASAAVLRVLPGPPVATIASSLALPEGNAGTTAFGFSVNLSSAATSNVVVRYQTSDGGATVADGDYVAENDSITILTGQSSGTITISGNGDTKHEANEAFSVTLTSVTNATLGATVLANGTLQNDDAEPQLSVDSVSDNEVDAGTQNFDFTVTLSQASGLPVTVDWATEDSTAFAGGDPTLAEDDYVAASGSLVFSPGQITKPVVIAVLGDTLHESYEQFEVHLSNPVGATLDQSMNYGEIVNNDIAPFVSIGDVSQAEGDAGATQFEFPMWLSERSATTTSVDSVTTLDGSATIGSADYVPLGISVVFAPGETLKTVTVLVNGDPTAEPDEAFTVYLNQFTDLNPGDYEATGTIQDDDTVPTLVVTDVTANETDAGTTVFSFTAHLAYAVGADVTAEFTTMDGSATEANGDFVALAGMLTVPAGDTTATVNVTVNGDVCGEPDETFTLALTNPSGAALGNPSALATITNDDDAIAPAVTVTAPNGGEIVAVGSLAAITWNASDVGGVTAVDVALSRDGGATFGEALATGIANSGSFDWTVTAPATAVAGAFVRVTAHDAGCNATADASDAGFQVQDPITAAPGAGSVAAFALGRVIPNPTSGAAQVEFDLPREAAVRLVVVDTQGREVAPLVSGTYPAGRHLARWDGRARGGPAPVGIYFVRYSVAGKSFTRRLALVR